MRTGQIASTLRRLAAAPSFTAIALLTLALGIAGNITIFSVVNTLLLRPLPYPDSERLVLLWHTAPGIDLERFGQADATYFHYRDHADTLTDIAVADDREMTLLVGDEAERVDAAVASASLLGTFRIAPALGRGFSPGDEDPGSGRTALLSSGLWRRRFDADPAVVGRVVQLDGEPVEIIGVMPEGFAFPDLDTQIWTAMKLSRSEAHLDGFGYVGIGRLRDGVTAEQSQSQLNQLLTNLPERFPEEEGAEMFEKAGLAARVVPAKEFLVGDIRAALWIVLAAVGFLLLIACANVANLFLVRAETRQREIAIRRALGESRTQVVGSMLAESTLLGLASGVLALPLGAGAVHLLVQRGPQELPRIQEISMDGRVVLFALVASLAAGLLFGIVPALRAAFATLSETLRDGTRSMTGGRGRNRFRSALVSLQIALAMVLLVGSGLAARSFARLSNVDPGFDAEDVSTFRVFLPATDYETGAEVAAFHRVLVDRLTALPGVESAAAVSSLPMSGSVSGTAFAFEDHPAEPGEVPPILFTKVVSGDYFRTLGIELLEGRTLNRHDEESEAAVVVVNERVARHYFPDGSALGKRISTAGTIPDPEKGERWDEIVGVVANVRDRGLHLDAPELVYFPAAAGGVDRDLPRSMSYTVRGPAALAGAAREIVRSLDPHLPVARVSTMQELVNRSKRLRAFTLTLLLVAAAVALLLGAIGLYGVISFLVTQRDREFAIRMAVGAAMPDIQRLVLRDAAFLGAIGIGVGLVAAVALTRTMASLLFEVSPLDPVTFAAVPVLLLAVTIAASYLPARKAARSEPSRVLHSS